MPSRAAAWGAATLDRLPPAAGGVVMATGIVSVALADDHRAVLSDVLLAVAIAAWAALGLALARRALARIDRVREEASLPAALTGVAGTAVLGARLDAAGATWAGWVALALAAPLWVAVLVALLPRWKRPTVGASFLLVVATESLAILLCALGGRADIAVALVLGVAGLVAYAWVLRDFDWRHILRGSGDHWVAGGALAIAALAGAELATAAAQDHTLDAVHAVLADGGDVVLFVLALAWVPVLVTGELLRPRLRYDVNRWATVFPLGMYAAAGFAATGATWPHGFAGAWVWVAVAAWAVAAAGALRHGLLTFERAAAPSRRHTAPGGGPREHR